MGAGITVPHVKLFLRRFLLISSLLERKSSYFPVFNNNLWADETGLRHVLRAERVGKGIEKGEKGEQRCIEKLK